MAVDRNYILDKMRGKMMTPDQFNFEALQAPPLMSLLTPTDIGDLNCLATSIRYSGNPILRLQRQDELLKKRGFRKFTGGTNRVVYKFLEDDSFLIKVASDAVGIGDSPREWINQIQYKPFITKVHETSPCGTVGLFERVIPITSREEFLSVASDIYDVITNWFIGKFVMDDIGTKFFMNWGIRKGFGPVLLDFPYSYKLDGNKLYCNVPLPNSPTHICGGVIDYDNGFNHLRCTKCGTIYRAKELENAVKNETVLIKGGKTKMKISFGYEGTKVVNDTTNFIDTAPKLKPRKAGKKSKIGELKVSAPMKKTADKTSKVNEKNDESVNNRGRVVANVSYNKQNNVETKETTNNDSNESFKIFSAEVSNIRDITGDDTFEKKKCIVLTDDVGNLIELDDIGYVIIDKILNRPVSDIRLLTKEAHDELINSIDGLQDEIASLREENELLKNEVFDLREMVGDNDEEPDDNEDEENSFNTESPLLSPLLNNSGKIPKEIYIEASSARAEQILQNVNATNNSTNEDESKDEESEDPKPPVGAAPPNGRSRKYDPDFYK